MPSHYPRTVSRSTALIHLEDCERISERCVICSSKICVMNQHPRHLRSHGCCFLSLSSLLSSTAWSPLPLCHSLILCLWSHRLLVLRLLSCSNFPCRIYTYLVWTTRSGQCYLVPSSASCEYYYMLLCRCRDLALNTACNRLYGMTLHQTFRYFRRYPTDRRWLKAMVRSPSEHIIGLLSSDSSQRHYRSG